MNILVVGSGGREHAIIKKLRESSQIDKIYALPGNAGFKKDAECVEIEATDIEGVVAFAKNHKVDFAVVAPDDPLVMGMVDSLEEIGVPCFGPTKDAAIIEGSKAFSKELMKKYDIPTAEYEIFNKAEDAIKYVKEKGAPIVVKADGLAKGKGVLIAETEDEAVSAIKTIMEDKKFGESGNTVVVEEFLTGPEVSVLSFTDGKTLIPMVSSMDHKRALDGDRGLNTGGMGTVAPNPYYTPEIADLCMKKIFVPTLNAMNDEGRTFKGCLYFGLMLTKRGPKVIEYNCRFGDPETQVVLPLLKSDLFTIMQNVRYGRLMKEDVEFSKGAACCVVMASEGYPGTCKTGKKIDIKDEDNIFFAGVGENSDGELVTAGGRVLGVTATAETLGKAIKAAYRKVGTIHFDGAQYRKDIGQRALKALED